MDGIEKITARINQDVQAEIDARTAQAQAQADQIKADYEAQAQALREELTQRGERDAAEREERMASVAQLEGRKVLLAAKQQMLNRAFDRALEKLCSLEDEAYIALLADLLVEASSTGREQVVFNQKDRTRVGKAAVTQANERLARAVAPKLPEELTDSKVGALVDKVVTGVSALAQGTGMLTLAEETRPIQGGFILLDGKVKVNCAFETLVRLQRTEMAAQVAAALFD